MSNGRNMNQPPIVETAQITPRNPADEIADLKRELENQRAEMAELRNLVAGSGSAGTSALLERIDQRLDRNAQRAEVDAKRTAKIESQITRAEQTERELACGPKQFLVYLTGEACMCRVVGAPDEANARARFERHHGILRVLDTGKNISVRELRTDEAERETAALNLAAPQARALRGRDILGLPAPSPSFVAGGAL